MSSNCWSNKAQRQRFFSPSVHYQTVNAKRSTGNLEMLKTDQHSFSHTQLCTIGHHVQHLLLNFAFLFVLNVCTTDATMRAVSIVRIGRRTVLTVRCSGQSYVPVQNAPVEPSGVQSLKPVQRSALPARTHMLQWLHGSWPMTGLQKGSKSSTLRAYLFSKIALNSFVLGP